MKKAIKIVFDVIAWIVLIFALIITILVFSSDKNNGTASLFGYIPLTVESDSMKPTFKKDDLIISKEIDDVKSLKKGDVITFWTIIDGQKVKNTHRIEQVLDENGSIGFITRGDANDSDDSYTVYAGDIVGEWTNVKIGGFGKVMDYLRTKTGFFVCILLPIALFFLFEVYKLIATIVEIKKPAITESDEEEIKRRAVEEYLAHQKKEEEEKAQQETEKKE
ncbi:signal peptidase I [Ruminococcus sp.]|uniref:signal peptidase I n=1 Tax=Ruminococcus sp. TaxID=41978 RepID=UPI0025E0AC33|nr:signal peptidase I [Ruminococcus sp.]